MKRWRNPEIFFGALLAVGIFGFGYAVSFARRFPRNDGDHQQNSYENQLIDPLLGFWDWLFGDPINLFTMILAGSTVWLAVATRGLWNATKVQVSLTRQALETENRAFVFAPTFFHFASFDKATGQYGWRFTPSWKNTGNTQTKTLRIYVSCELLLNPMPDDFDFDQMRRPHGTGLLGPLAETMGGVVPVPGEEPPISAKEISEVQAGIRFLYVWGWVRYFDVFSEREHLTRFAWQMFPVGDPFRFNPIAKVGEPGHLAFSNLQLSRGNCADDECAEN